ncbi:MAG: DUF1269 domain-containing protein [Ruminococcaceae bacterium]|nr:DUF1269 domain-containing protein [Oscillospiraceae bacterium]
MENVIIAIFEDESKAYEGLSELKNLGGKTAILEAAVMQNNVGYVQLKDSWTNADKTDNWMAGGLIGGIVGILGGPLGMLLGAGLGAVVGSVVDTDDQDSLESVTEQVAYHMGDAHLALITVADEPDNSELDAFFGRYGVKQIIRQDAASVQAEIYQAEEATKKLRKEAKANMRKEKRKQWHEKATEATGKVKEDFEKLKKKL